MICLVGGGEGMMQSQIFFSHIVVPVAQVKSYQMYGQRRLIACDDPSLYIHGVDVSHVDNPELFFISRMQSFKISRGIPNRSRLESWIARIQEADFCMNKSSLGWGHVIAVIKIQCKCWIQTLKVALCVICMENL